MTRLGSAPVALGAVVALIALAPGVARAQALELCQAEWLDPERLRAVLSIELRGAAADASFAISECDADAVRVHAAAPGAEPSALDLSLTDVAPSARTRFVALVLAELVRSSPSPELPAAAVADEVLRDEVLRDEVLPDELAEAPAGEPPPVPLPAVVLASPDALATPLIARLDEPAEARRPPPPRRWTIAATGGYRSYFGAESASAIGEAAVQLRHDRLLVEVRGGGAVPDTGAGTGTARVIQTTVGGGVRILDVGGYARFRLDAVAEAGFMHILGQPRFLSGAFGRSIYALVLAATVRPAFVLRFDPVDIALEGHVGYQRGPALQDNGFTFANYDGLLIGANLGVGIRL